MSDRSLQRFLVVLAACLVAVVVAGSVLGSRTVAGDLARRSTTVLAAADLADVTVTFSGREAELSGGNDVESRLATELVGALPGVRAVEAPRDDLPVAAGESAFELDRAGDDVEISGVVPTPDDAATLKVAVATTLRTTVTGDVVVDGPVSAAPWVETMSDALEVVAGVEGLSLDIRGDGTVEVGGQVPDAASHRVVLRDLAAALPDLEVVDVLRVLSPARKGA